MFVQVLKGFLQICQFSVVDSLNKCKWSMNVCAWCLAMDWHPISKCNLKKRNINTCLMSVLCNIQQSNYDIQFSTVLYCDVLRTVVFGLSTINLEWEQLFIDSTTEVIKRTNLSFERFNNIKYSCKLLKSIML